MSQKSPRFTRVQARYCGRLGVEVGIFVAVDHLRRAGKLTADQVAAYLDVDDWFREHLPEPPFYVDGNSIGAVTWFKEPTPAGMTSRIQQLTAILRDHDVPHDTVISTGPGRIVYEDAYQVGVVPAVRKPPTAMPADLTLGPTTAGSKRDLLHGRVN